MYLDSRDDRDNIQDMQSNPSRSFFFPSLQFDQNCSLQSWVFAAELNANRPLKSSSGPVFCILRRQENGIYVDQTRFTTTRERTGYLNVYNFILDPPIFVQSGDFIGVSTSTLLLADLTIQWVMGEGSSYYVGELESGGMLRNLGSQGRAVPLFAAQIQGRARINAEGC